MEYKKSKRDIPFVKRSRLILFPTKDVYAYLDAAYVPARKKGGGSTNSTHYRSDGPGCLLDKDDGAPLVSGQARIERNLRTPKSAKVPT